MRPIRLRITLIPFLSHWLIQAFAELSPSVYQEQKARAQNVILIQVQSNSPAKMITLSSCGKDLYYDTTAVVVAVNRTNERNSNSSIGDSLNNSDKNIALSAGNVIEFTTYEKEWIGECVGPSDPGLKETGWCGYVYLNSSDVEGEPYYLAAGGQSFQEQESSVCYPRIENDSGIRNGSQMENTEYSPEIDAGQAVSSGSDLNSNTATRFSLERRSVCVLVLVSFFNI